MRTLPEATLEAFKSMNFKVIEPLVMTYDLFTQIGKLLSPEQAHEERQRLARQAAKRAILNTQRSFDDILFSTKRAGFNWANCNLLSLKAKSPGKKKSTWHSYSENEGILRIDAHLRLSTDDISFQLKIDDCFLINGRRFIGGGFTIY